MYGFVIFLIVFIIVLIFDITCIVLSSDADKRMENIEIKNRSDE